MPENADPDHALAKFHKGELGAELLATSCNF